MAIREDSVRKICEQFKSASSVRQQVEHLWDDASDLISPTRSQKEDDFLTPGRDRTLQIYDNTAQTDAMLLSADMHGRSVSGNVPWFALAPVDPRLAAEKDHESDLWIENSGHVLNAVFNSPSSGYMTSTYEILQDLVSYGTGFRMRHDFGGNDIQFEARSLFESYFHVDHRNRVRTVFRKMMMTAVQAVDMFGVENLSAAVVSALGTGKEHITRTPFLHAITPRTDRDFRNVSSDNMPIASVYIDLESKKVARESGFKTMPFSAPRWALPTGQTYGEGPGIQVMDDVRLANAIAKSQIEGHSRESNPAYLVNDADVFGSFNNFPGGVTYRRGNEGVDILPTGNVRVGDELLAQTQQAIHRAFLIDKIEIPQNDRMTTTEVIERSMSSVRVFSPFTSRMQMELFTPDIEWTLNKAIEKGWIDQPPERLNSAGGVKVEYVSPLTLTQRLAEAQSINLWLDRLIPLANIDPTVLDAVNMESVPGLLARGLNVPASAVRDPKLMAERQRQRQVLQDSINEAAAVERVATAAEGAANATQAVGNALSIAG